MFENPSVAIEICPVNVEPGSSDYGCPVGDKTSKYVYFCVVITETHLLKEEFTTVK